MMSNPTLVCSTSERRAQLHHVNLDPNRRHFNGIDYVEFERHGKIDTLRVYFLCQRPADFDQPLERPPQFDLYSPILRRHVKVTKVSPHASCSDSVMLETESRLCPGAAYTLTLRSRTDIDPQFARFEFSAHDNTVEIDPRPRPPAAHCGKTDPKINYLARDYASFRQVLFDRLAQIIPEWTERHVPDLGVTLVELFAYVGDYLAYYQDAVATEAYLNTARQRISVKRHARLVDYQLHEGCNARTFVHLNVAGPSTVSLDPTDIFFITEHPDPRNRARAVLDPSEIEDLPPNSFQPFEIVRRKPACRKLRCEDLKNVVGLMAALVRYDSLNDQSLSGRVAEFIYSHLPDLLKEDITAYVQTADAKPGQLLQDRLLASLNSMMQQWCLPELIQLEDLSHDETYRRLERYLNAPPFTLEQNIAFLTIVFSDFFSRMDDSRIELHPAQNELRFYTWNLSECHLPVGTTRATLCDDPNCTPYVDSPTLLIPDAIPYDDDPVQLPDGNVSTTAKEANAKSSPLKLSRYVLAHLDLLTSNLPKPDEPQRGWNLRHLSAGDILILEEKYGPVTHNPADANPAHRQAVRLTRVNFSVDPVSLVRIVEIEWDHADALTFPVCISSIGPVEDGCQLKHDISVAHGNVVLVDHGVTLAAEWIGEPLEVVTRPRCGDSYLDETVTAAPSREELFQPILREQNLTFAEDAEACSSASKLLVQEPHKAVPSLEVHSFPVATEPADAFRDDHVPPPTLMTLDDLTAPLQFLTRLAGMSEVEIRRIEMILPPHATRFLQDYRSNKNGVQSVVQSLARQNAINRISSLVKPVEPAGTAEESRQHKEAAAFAAALQSAVTWNSKLHLLDSSSESQDVVVELDNERRTHLRFGNDDLGRRPMSQTSFYATYRVGNGGIGNVGAGKIKHMVYRVTRPTGINAIINPLPATGGLEPESLDHARARAPSQYKKARRAITANDYAEIAVREFADEIQQARAMLHWMGTWYEVSVAVDPKSTVTNPDDLVKRVDATLQTYRRIGHLLTVALPTYVGLDIAMTVCVQTSYLSAHVRQELLDRFSSGVLDDGTRGFFHPDNFGFGDALYLSQIIAEAKKVQGVENVHVTRFQKQGQGDQGELDSGIMVFGSREIPRLDNNPLRSEAGNFSLRMEGTR